MQPVFQTFPTENAVPRAFTVKAYQASAGYYTPNTTVGAPSHYSVWADYPHGLCSVRVADRIASYQDAIAIRYLLEQALLHWTDPGRSVFSSAMREDARPEAGRIRHIHRGLVWGIRFFTHQDLPGYPCPTLLFDNKETAEALADLLAAVLDINRPAPEKTYKVIVDRHEFSSREYSVTATSEEEAKLKAVNQARDALWEIGDVEYTPLPPSTE